ncbi:hypothetical protein HBH56_231310 [Parastagonospora nodorum]|nr:hypothetical protein HBH56_231310 [Parastagonospora nodorum]KAH3924551.1 hypothetical protein HBH54_193840 [Parastagonospora nodorum]KAH3960254.1 hypothetical protein HBH52_238330 [Parastagonospora nodorum]KAH4115043.1 hypothetical protein HBH47_187300 [Parastagonospora nodorum]KAH4130493.1 hypothetical protein HBH45_197780 [Parastagonospora nodorum]
MPTTIQRYGSMFWTHNSADQIINAERVVMAAAESLTGWRCSRSSNNTSTVPCGDQIAPTEQWEHWNELDKSLVNSRLLRMLTASQCRSDCSVKGPRACPTLGQAFVSVLWYVRRSGSRCALSSLRR